MLHVPFKTDTGHLLVVPDRLVEYFGLDYAALIMRLDYLVQTSTIREFSGRKWTHITKEALQRWTPWWTVDEVWEKVIELIKKHVVIFRERSFAIKHAVCLSLDYELIDNLDGITVDRERLPSHE